MTRNMTPRYCSLTLAAGALTLAGSMAHAQFTFGDREISGSLCVGQDCVNGESFGFDTLRLKENNLRIKFQDTSSSASFPTNDWQLTANDSSNGGANKFSIDDIDGGRTPFTIEAGAPSNSLYVEDGGRVGFGTSTPVVDLHVKSGNTPTLRLEQDGSSGFTPQTWDVAGNEANFFIRDASNGSTLPFKIFPGAPSDALTIEATTGDVGLNTTSPEAPLHIKSTTANAELRLEAAGGSFITFADVTNGDNWFITKQNTDDGDLEFTSQSNGGNGIVVAMRVEDDGDLLVTGNISSGGTQLAVPDYVFAEDYELAPLYEVEKFIVANRHLPNIPSAADVRANGLNMTEMQMALLEKVEELTLYTLQQQKTIDALQQQMDTLNAD
jgi:hypothetical protein